MGQMCSHSTRKVGEECTRLCGTVVASVCEVAIALAEIRPPFD